MGTVKEKPKVIIVGHVRHEIPDLLGACCELQQWRESYDIPPDLWNKWLTDADAMVTAGNLVTEDILRQGKKLRVIAQASVGVDNIDLAACTRYGVPVGNTPEVLTETTAELAFTLVACAARRITEAWDFVRNGQWEQGGFRQSGMDLSRRTIGIIGMGRIGISISRRAKAFGMTVLYNNRHQRSDDELRCTTYVTKDELLAQSDVVLVMAPLTPSTYHSIGREEFRKMKNTAIFVNVGRGAIVDTDALVEALQHGEIAQAALDVVEPEPLPKNHPLLQLPNVLIVPHIGSYTKRTRSEMAQLTARNILNGLDRKPLEACINSEVNYK